MSQAETIRTLLGHLLPQLKTDFARAEKALELVAEIRKLSWATTIPENLLKLITNASNPSPMIKNLGFELQASVDKWEQQDKEVRVAYPYKHAKIRGWNHLDTSPLQVEEWATEAERQLNPLMRIDERNSGNMQTGTPKLQATVGRPQKRRRHTEERSRHRRRKSAASRKIRLTLQRA